MFQSVYNWTCFQYDFFGIANIVLIFEAGYVRGKLRLTFIVKHHKIYIKCKISLYLNVELLCRLSLAFIFQLRDMSKRYLINSPRGNKALFEPSFVIS